MSDAPHDPVPAVGRRHEIAVVGERTGLSLDVLRVWERRHAAVAPDRGPGGQRLYSDADVERLCLLEAAVRGGRRIGAVAALPTAELAALVHDDRVAALRRATAPRRPDRGDGAAADGQGEGEGEGEGTAAEREHAETVGQALAHARALDPRALDRLLRRTLAIGGAAVLLDGVVAPLLRRIGEEWHAGRFGIAEEHAASAVIEGVVVELMRTMAPPGGAPAVVVATLAGSRHVIPAAMAGAVAAAEGWSVLHLGGELPPAEIAAAAAAGGARAVAVSVVYAADRARLAGELATLRERLPAHVPLVVGGRATLPLAAELGGRGIVVGETLDALRVALRRIPAAPRPVAG